MNKIVKMSLSLTLCFAMLFAPNSVNAVSTDEIDNLKNQQAAILDKKESYEQQLAALEADQKRTEEYQEILQQQILVTGENIQLTTKNIELLNDSIDNLTVQLEKSAAKYEETLELLKERIIAIYKSGNVTAIEILLNSSSLYDFSLRAQTLESVAEHDKALMEKIQVYADETEAERKLLQQQKSEVEVLQKKLKADMDEADKLYKDNEEVIAQLMAQSDEVNGEISILAQANANFENQIADLIEQKRKEEEEAAKREEEEAQKEEANNSNNNNNNSGGSSSGGTSKPDDTDYPSVEGSGDFCFPIPAGHFYVITSPFGYRDGGFHSGYDIAGARNTPLLAIASGQVITANGTDSWGYGWGHYVSIYHNATYTSLYAHMESVAVSQGQYVEKGQVIGYMGSTGDSTGYHLHLEVYQNGTKVDPAMFIY